MGEGKMSMAVFCIFAIFAFVGTLGLFRFPDVYTRIHAATLIAISGIVLPLVTLAYMIPEYRTKIVLISLIILVANATTGHAIGRASYRHGIKPKNLEKNDLGKLK